MELKAGSLSLGDEARVRRASSALQGQGVKSLFVPGRRAALSRVLELISPGPGRAKDPRGYQNP